jgi:hypothetical protein
MIGDEQRFAEDGLAIAVLYPSEQIGRGTGNEILHRLQIDAEGGDAAVPGSVIVGTIAVRPISFWELR